MELTGLLKYRDWVAEHLPNTDRIEMHTCDEDCYSTSICPEPGCLAANQEAAGISRPVIFHGAPLPRPPHPRPSTRHASARSSSASRFD